ncbi:MAG: acyl-CoA carboxylase subunit epsilon, partial [Trebonia sp.]
ASRVADDAPFLRIVHGDATPEEIAAIVATLTAIAAARSLAADAEEPAPVRTNWNDPVRRLRAPVQPAPGAWRRSALP